MECIMPSIKKPSSYCNEVDYSLSNMLHFIQKKPNLT